MHLIKTQINHCPQSLRWKYETKRVSCIRSFYSTSTFNWLIDHSQIMTTEVHLLTLKHKPVRRNDGEQQDWVSDYGWLPQMKKVLFVSANCRQSEICLAMAIVIMIHKNMGMLRRVAKIGRASFHKHTKQTKLEDLKLNMQKRAKKIKVIYLLMPFPHQEHYETRTQVTLKIYGATISIL